MNIQILTIFIAIATLAGLAITPVISDVIPAYAESPHKDSPSDDDSGGGNDPPKKRGNHPSRNG